MLKGTLFDLEEDGLPFVIYNEDEIIVTPHDGIIRWFESRPDPCPKEIVNGELSDGRPIRFFGCRYDGRAFSSQGYVYAHNNLEPDPLESFSAIRFTGAAIDNLSGGVFSVFDREDIWSVSERMSGITPKKWEAITNTYKSEVAGLPCEITIDYYINYNLQWGERQIGTCTPRFSISFPTPVDIKYIPDIYLGVYDFFAFLSFCRSITFDSITLYEPNTGNKFYPTADVKIFSKYNGIKRKSHFETVTLNDLGDNLGCLFSKIAARRKDKIFDNLFIPEGQSDYLSVSHSSFLACALSFEGEYDRLEPMKEEQNSDFKQVKEIAYDSVVSSASTMTGIEETEIRATLLDGFEKALKAQTSNLLDGKSNTKKKKILRYAQKMIDELRRADFSLEEQFNAMLKKYSPVIGSYKEKLAERMEISPQEYSNLGQIFSNFRNQIGHGHPEPIKKIHFYVFLVGRCLTYAMILNSAGFDGEQASKVINKLFRCY